MQTAETTAFHMMLLRFGSYRTYLKSKHWRNLKEERIFLDGGQCVKCGSRHNLQVHHLSYEHIFTGEEIDDLVTLCEQCHKAEHVRRIDAE